jgi:hypothetical protein
MITLKLGFVGVSLVAAFWATTSVAPQMDRAQPAFALQFTPANPAENGTVHGEHTPSHNAALPHIHEALGNFAPHCRDVTCDFGALMSMAFSH